MGIGVWVILSHARLLSYKQMVCGGGKHRWPFSQDPVFL